MYFGSSIAEVHVFRNKNTKAIYSLVEFLKKQFNADRSRKLAYLTTTPHHVVLSTLFSKKLDDSRFYSNAKIFSTIESAAIWLSIDNMNEENLATIFDELKTQPDNVHNS